MFKKKKKNIIINLFNNQMFLTFVGLVLIILISVPLGKAVSKKYKINNDVKELENEILRLEKKNLEFEKIVDYLESDEFIEEKSRLNLGLKKEGEEVFVVNKKTEDVEKIETDNLYNIPGLDKQKKSKSKSNISKWIDYFF